MTERYETRGRGDATIPWAEVPDQTIIYELGTETEMLRLPGLVLLPTGAIVQLGLDGDAGNPRWDGIVRTVILASAIPGGKPSLRLGVELVPPA
jgi:hypothetical protein